MFLILHVIIVVGFTIRILLRDDLSPTSRLAWFVVILILPYVGGALYFLFGEIDLGHHANEHHSAIWSDLKSQCGAVFSHEKITHKLVSPAYQPGFFYAASVNGFYTTAGNTVELMPDQVTARGRLIEDIEAAKDHVHVLYYIWLEDHTGIATAKAIIRAAQRGVICRVMVDGLGSRAFVNSHLWEKMRTAGVHTAVSLSLKHPIHTILTSRIDLRNHRKITIIDNAITYCGSQNCADPEFRIKAKYAPWVDIMTRVKGSVVAQNQVLFASDWVQTTGETLDNLPFVMTTVSQGIPAQIMGDGPTGRLGSTPQLFSTLISTAQRALTISTPYFVPDSTVLEALCAAAHRGVNVALIFPKHNDSWVVSAASRSYYGKLLQAGAKIYEFRDGLLHAKTLTIDGIVSLIGSSNLDLRSFDLNYENNLLLYDKAVSNNIQERQSEYIARSDPVAIEDVLAWPRRKRIWQNVIATIGPVL
ncbi:cardiolipin synthase [Microbulbifer spongiae]|uniref:Cardiolipin synthase n=1 Tax=Microbulbifer spongiae TaxID=2944933 RepID=A0ABY9E8C2_9GAMM|nr:cardiolipin synthase [Microbulbifer sp. MI-G]WKD49258.1 cardiolipin synthase [Microbulbifer sp. MI-G]